MWAEVLSRSGTNGWTARKGGQIATPDLVIMFGSTTALTASDPGQELVARFPNAVHIGASTGTSVANQVLSDEGSVALALGFANTRIRSAIHALGSADESEQVGFAIGKDLASSDLAGVFLLSDGLSVNGSALVRGLTAAVGPQVVISGGLAGDGPRFAETAVSLGGIARPNSIVAVGLYGSAIRIAHGSTGGWDAFGPKRAITRSDGNVLLELDGVPALDLYERYLGVEAADLPASGLLYPLMVWDPRVPENEVVRTLLAVDREARSLKFAGDVPQGWDARLMRGSFHRLVDGASNAAKHAHASLASIGFAPEACLLVSCVGRRLLMQQRTDDEVAAVASVVGDATPMIGFYSYGEIAPSNTTGFCGLHNQTMTLTLLAEAAQ